MTDDVIVSLTSIGVSSASMSSLGVLRVVQGLGHSVVQRAVVADTVGASCCTSAIPETGVVQHAVTGIKCRCLVLYIGCSRSWCGTACCTTAVPDGSCFDMSMPLMVKGVDARFFKCTHRITNVADHVPRVLKHS